MTTAKSLRRILCASSICLGWLCAAALAIADDDELAPPGERPEAASPRQKIVFKTLGGRQYWGDVLFFRGWRIQQNVLTGHYRLLDPANCRHASGSRNECDDMLAEVKRQQRLEPMSGKAVVLVHGIVRSSKSFDKMAARLREEGYTVVGFDYPSTRADIGDSAERLHSVIESLEGVEEIDFVVHSMGGLVVRTYLQEHQNERINRMVMLGVPNRGASLADLLRKNSLYRIIYGPAGQQLVSDPEGFIAGLPTPEFEFAVVAGGRDNLAGYNPLVPGDDDGTVGVASARLPGATDFLLVHCLHSFLMKDKQVIDATLRYLETGRLRESGDPHPIPAAAESDEAVAGE